jgi:HPt (histidine-containing phosphotransfer) domain-containing protein
LLWLAQAGRPDLAHLQTWDLRMPLPLERINWMPSPPLAPDIGPIDVDHLQRMTLGNVRLEHEVLAMFSAQVASLLARLGKLPNDASAIAHTIKGSARGIGAFAVATAAADVETAIRTGLDPSMALSELDDAVVEACAAIDVILRRS